MEFKGRYKKNREETKGKKSKIRTN